MLVIRIKVYNISRIFIRKIAKILSLQTEKKIKEKKDMLENEIKEIQKSKGRKFLFALFIMCMIIFSGTNISNTADRVEFEPMKSC